jgi:hypothetical protein
MSCPDVLGELTTLEMLALSNNPFTELSKGIGRLLSMRDMLLDGLKLVVSIPRPFAAFTECTAQASSPVSRKTAAYCVGV